MLSVLLEPDLLKVALCFLCLAWDNHPPNQSSFPRLFGSSTSSFINKYLEKCLEDRARSTPRCVLNCEPIVLHDIAIKNRLPSLIWVYTSVVLRHGPPAEIHEISTDHGLLEGLDRPVRLTHVGITMTLTRWYPHRTCKSNL